ncbi:MAG: metallophosphoesterase family protein [Chloroflexota bacterium]
MVVTADNHLGRHYDRMFPQKLEERRAWLRRGFGAAVEHALEHRAHLFLQVGDLFDSPEPRNVERQFVAEALSRLRDAGVRCLGIGGNHDTPRVRNGHSMATPQGTYARLGGLRLLGESRTEVRGLSTERTSLSPQSSVLSPWLDVETLEIEGVRVAVGGMAPDPTAPAGSDPLEGLEWRPEADISLLLLHGSLEGHVYPGAPEPIVRRATVEGLEGVDYLLMGHVHRFAAFCWGGKTVIVPGATERMTFAEVETRPGFVYMEAEPGRLAGLQQIPVECQPRLQLAIPTSELAEGDPAEVAKARVETVCRRDAMVRVSLEGPISRQRYHDLRLREVAEFGAGRSFFFDLDTTGLYVEDERQATSARGGRLSQREELIRFAREGLEAAGSQRERDLIDEALRMILDEYR